MKLQKVAVFAAIAAIALGTCFGRNLEAAPESSSADSNEKFLGRWDLTLKAPDREYPSWLELREAGGKLQAEMVGRWGNARPLPKASISGGKLTVVSPKDEEASKQDMVFEGTLKGEFLSGTVNAPNGGTWTWTGRRAPSLKRSGTPKWGEPIPLFNGKDLCGWHLCQPNATTVWKVENGTLISPGNGPELISDKTFEDFKLHVEFNCGETSNSGIYLRGRYEVQIETDSIDEPPSHHTGGVYGFLAPDPEQPRRAGVWQVYDITLIGRRVTVVQNGQTVINDQEIPGITGGALDSHEELPGPIYLQGSEKGHVLYRSIVITPETK
ncbi:MAG TPA: DUF1080 domain-containing protein [Terriglobales bacterium]|nr:DUF1080 domain-containing protein [Terriglobales bacterium]